MNNKVVLCTSLNNKVLSTLNKENPDCIYCYKKSNLHSDEVIYKNINYIKINDCKKYINKIDLIIIDLALENKEQYLELKTLLKLLMKSDLKPNLKLISIKETSDMNLSDDSRIYKDYINYFLEGVIKFRGLLA